LEDIDYKLLLDVTFQTAAEL